VKFPVWLDPKGSGGTPMQDAIGECVRLRVFNPRL